MIRAVKGTRDILPPASAAWNHVEAVAREVFRTYNYQEIRTPLFEETALFARGVGEDTDIVGKEMYTWEDRDGSSLTLRPEATASVMRAYIEHRLDQIPGVKKFYYMGPMFRRERPQKGRFRQFYQIGAEAIGSESPVVDAEVIEMVVELLRRCGLEGFQLILNSVGCKDCRPAYLALLREKLAEVAPTCAAIASAARPRIRCACSIAKFPKTSRISTRCLRSWIIWTKRAASTSRPCARTWMPAGSPTKCARGWCAAWITTCARRSRSRTGHWEPRTPFWAGAATTGWRKPSARRFPRRASDFRSAKTAW